MNIFKNNIIINNIEYFSFVKCSISYEGSSFYTIKKENDKYICKVKPNHNKERILEIKDSDINKLENLLNSLNISKWNKFHKSNPFLIDGLSFSLQILLENGDRIKASGGNKFPNNYSEVSEKLDLFFKELYFNFI